MKRTKKYRAEAAQSQNWRCFYCCRPMGRHPTAEHLKARKDGGTDRRDNIVAACHACNHGRHADPRHALMPPEDYATLVLLTRAAGVAPMLAK